MSARAFLSWLWGTLTDEQRERLEHPEVVAEREAQDRRALVLASGGEIG